MSAKFAGKDLFGQVGIRQLGPFARTRNQRETLPGVPGYRNYQLTGGVIDTQFWQIQGRYLGFSLRDCEKFILLAQSYMDGSPYLFETNSGLKFRNCELTDWRQISPFQQVKYNNIWYCTFELQATVEQMSP
jgi:hypothetical protein